ncbi:MAG TPA: tyrosine--tRNA ligase [Methanoregulaceae archaeon]|mgnify:CR=1 FL=1|nr:MAG: tyrosine--tRNA ligase [Methanolinea sp.]HON80696.1 tyrosine--tRNA ligase [Methanoregulaceae archaeon]HPD09430.1 tyrosine--tRNA ligase [Methanoregulaceae archaeon]HRT14777.1 tyrosine--tRNA ligase [Methanoregulaceae archaeon]HRU30350.1 tyrosine--tRNA ligase [Methanoregulaceae archaeon]
MDPYELVTRNTVEVITDDELKALLARDKKRVYAGYEPSGEIHLGHLVTINKLIDLKEAGFEVVVLLADLHAFLNRKGTMEQVRELAGYNRRCFEGLGLRDVEYVLGSDLQLAPDYQLKVLQLSQQITLNRARRSMDEVGRNMEAPTVSQMIYPIMQMVDIALLNVDAAVGGIDQRKIHMLAREHLAAVGYPSPVCIHTPILNGLDGKKMSSSSGNYISVADSVEEIEKKCQKAFCPPECEENPVLQILQYHIFPRMGTVVVRRPAKFGGDREFRSYPEIEEAYRKKELHPLDLKKAVATNMAGILSCVRDYIT